MTFIIHYFCYCLLLLPIAYCHCLLLFPTVLGLGILRVLTASALENNGASIIQIIMCFPFIRKILGTTEIREVG